MKKIIFSFVFLIICLFGFNFNVKAYKYYQYSGNVVSTFNNSYSPISNDLTSESYYENLFTYVKNFSNWHGNKILTFDDYSYIATIKSKCPPAGTPYAYCSNNNGYIIDITYYMYAPDVYPSSNSYTFRTIYPDILNIQATYSSTNSMISISFNYYYTAGNTYYTQYSTGSGTAFERTYYTTSNFDSLTTNFNSVPGFQSISTISGLTSYDPDMQISGWTKHCLSGQNTFFSVIPNTIDTTNHNIVDDFILFPYTIKNYGINWLQYDTITDTNLYDISYDTEFLYQYILNPYEEMQELADTYYMQLFNSKYSGLYNSLYGYNIFLNRYQYTADNKYNIQVFRFNNTYTERPFCSVVGGSSYCEDENGNIHGGGGRSHDELINEPQYDNNVCFYIPNTFTLKVWNVNDFNDIDDTLTIGGNDYDINTDSYELGYNYYITDNSYSGYAGYFKSLINACKIPLDFISSKITLFFDKLPPLIQYSIISGLFILIVIGLIKFLTGGK